MHTVWRLVSKPKANNSLFARTRSSREGSDGLESVHAVGRRAAEAEVGIEGVPRVTLPVPQVHAQNVLIHSCQLSQVLVACAFSSLITSK